MNILKTSMTKLVFGAAFLIGAVAILWIARIFLGVDKLGLAVTALIGAVYVVGACELWFYRRASASLTKALDNTNGPVDDLPSWLQQLDSSLRVSVSNRAQGERVGLPAPVLTPYLVGLLVMLGLLGTFIGMVDTLKGAVVALEGSSELEAIRAGLAAPIEGLGLAFGTSVAGVAASAMLGLLSTLSRRERLQASQYLDSKSESAFSHYSANYQQKMAFQAIQEQAQALPEVASQLTSLVASLENLGDQLGAKLLNNQEQFQSQTANHYKQLATSVEQSLKDSLAESKELLNSTIQPIADQTLAHLTDSAESVQQALMHANEQQIIGFNEAVNELRAEASGSIDSAVKTQADSTQALMQEVSNSLSTVGDELRQSTSSLLAGFDATSQQWVEQQNLQREQMSVATAEQLSNMEAVVADHLSQLTLSLEAPMTRLIETASETPKAAAQVIEKLRDEMTKNVERDNDLLAERAQLMEQLDTLSATLESNSKSQRDAIDALVENSSNTLSQVSQQFGEQMAQESSKLVGVADRFASSSVEIASMSESFGAAVGLFGESNAKLIESLTRIETSLEQSNSRSDEQLAYYVAQAREIIDHNLLSHQQILGALKSNSLGMPAKAQNKPEQLAVPVADVDASQSAGQAVGK